MSDPLADAEEKILRMARRERFWRWWDRVWPALAIALFVAGFSVTTDANCELFEGSHKRDVDQLAQTYDYLARLAPSALGDDLNAAVLRSLPRLERAARSDDAPDYCDSLWFGRPEPDPEIPERPSSLAPYVQD